MNSCKITCETLVSRSDLPLDLLASTCLLLSNTLPLLSSSASCFTPPTASPVGSAFALIPTDGPFPGSEGLAIDHLRRARTAFGLTYVGRLAEALSDSSRKSDVAFANVAAHYELRNSFQDSYVRVCGCEKGQSSPSLAPKSLEEVVGRRVSTTRLLLREGWETAVAGHVAEDVVESQECGISERMKFWAAKARKAKDENDRFAAARKLALIADDVHDFRLLEEAVALASQFSGPQSVFYKELQEMLRSFQDRKSGEIFFLPANPPGLQESGPVTPRASQVARSGSRVSTGGLPALSPWKPSATELSP